MDTATLDSSPTTDTAPVSTGTPTTPETSAAPAVSERPKSMREAFERVEAKATPPATTAPAATAQPGVSPPANPTAPIPLDVHTKALDNARTKAVAEYRQQYGWAEKIPKAQFDQIATEVQRASTDPVGYVMARIQEGLANPALANQLRTQLSQLGLGQPAAAPTSMDPDVEVMDASGKVIGATFSAERVKAIVQQSVQEAIGKEVQPLKSFHEQQQADAKQKAIEAKTAEHQASAQKQADTQWAELKDILDITDDADPLLNDVLQVWTDHPDWSVHTAALQVRKSKVKPRQEGQATQAAITEMQRKAAGNTANGRGTTATPARPRTREELRQFLEARDAG